jgi:hypothetical protein
MDMSSNITAIKLSKAQKRDLLRAYHDPDGMATGLAYGPMVALTQTHRLAKEIFAPMAIGFHIQINSRGREVAAELDRAAGGARPGDRPAAGNSICLAGSGCA